MGIVLHKVELFLRRVETAGIAHPPIGLVLNRHGIHADAPRPHIRQEGVQPGEELVVAVLAQLAALVALSLAVAACCRSVGLVFTWGRPGGAEDNAAALLHIFG